MRFQTNGFKASRLVSQFAKASRRVSQLAFDDVDFDDVDFGDVRIPVLWAEVRPMVLRRYFPAAVY